MWDIIDAEGGGYMVVSLGGWVITEDDGLTPLLFDSPEDALRYAGAMYDQCENAFANLA